MKLTLSSKSIFDEYLYKYLFVVVGLLYWVYGFTGRLSDILTFLVLLTLMPSIANIVLRSKRADFRIVLGVLTVAFGILTLVFCDSKKSTFITLLRPVEKMLVLGYCASEKDATKIERELKSLCRVIIILGTVILVASLGTYFAGVSIPYYISAQAATGESTLLYVGRYGGRTALCGVLANPNMASNFCVIYLGAMLCILDSSKRRLFGVALIALDIVMLVLTQSRGGVVGAVVILGIYGWFRFKEISSHSRSNRVFRLVIIFILIIAAILLATFGRSINFFGFLNRTQTNMENNTQIRLTLWFTSLRATFSSASNFFFGIGHEISAAMRAYCPVVLPPRLYTNVHNAYLQMALEFGVPSALMMIFYYFRILKLAVKSLRGTLGGNTLTVVLTGFVCSLLVINLVESDMLGRSMEGTFIWIFAGYLYAILRTRPITEL